VTTKRANHSVQRKERKNNGGMPITMRAIHAGAPLRSRPKWKERTVPGSGKWDARTELPNNGRPLVLENHDRHDPGCTGPIYPLDGIIDAGYRLRAILRLSAERIRAGRDDADD